MDFYEKNSEKYISDSYTYDLRRFYQFVEAKKSDTILDIGFGSGRDMEHFKALGADVYGVDNCKAFVEHATKKV